MTDPQDVLWPSIYMCPKCWLSEGRWDEDIVYSYLRLEYWYCSTVFAAWFHSYSILIAFVPFQTKFAGPKILTLKSFEIKWSGERHGRSTMFMAMVEMARIRLKDQIRCGFQLIHWDPPLLSSSH